jgi:hypothetical protein
MYIQLTWYIKVSTSFLNQNINRKNKNLFLKSKFKSEMTKTNFKDRN